MQRKKVSVDFDEKVLEKMDVERKKKFISRNWLIHYLINKWFKDDCKIIMED